MPYSFLITLALLCFAAKAETVNKYTGINGSHLIVKYSQEGHWYVDKLLVKPGKMQEIVSSRAFAFEIDASHYYDQLHAFKNSKSIVPISLTQSEVLGSSLWVVDKQWSIEWERRFAQWLKDEFTLDYFSKYNIPTDCADVAYALRWIFARNNSLPAAATLYGTGALFTHESVQSEWVNLPSATEWHQDLKFLAALNYLMRNTYTGTLKVDSFPIAIDSENFLVGTIHLDKSHTNIFHRVGKEENQTWPLVMVYSTLPIKIRNLTSIAYMDKGAIPKESGGLLSMRWPVLRDGHWGIIPAEQMPRYSLEQYTLVSDGKNYSETLMEKLGLKFSMNEMALNYDKILKTMLLDRAAIVQEGYDFCQVNDCEFNGVDYDAYSTPSRDRRIAATFINASKTMKLIARYNPEANRLWVKLINEELLINGVKRSLKEWCSQFIHRQLSSDPTDTPNMRWGNTVSDKYNALTSSLDRRLSYRETLLLQNQCLNSPETCSVGSETWKMNLTVDFDEEIFTLFEGLVKTCSETPLFCDSTVPIRYKHIPFFISDPLATPEERKGNQVDINKVTITPWEKYYEHIGGNFFLNLSNNTRTLFDANTDEILVTKQVDNADLLNFSEINVGIFTHYEENVFYHLDYSSGMRTKVDQSYEGGVQGNVRFISPKHYFSTNGRSQSVFLFELRDGKRNLLQKFEDTKIYRGTTAYTRDSKPYVALDNENKLTWYYVENDIVKTLHVVSPIKDVFHGDKHYLYTAGDKIHSYDRDTGLAVANVLGQPLNAGKRFLIASTDSINKTYRLSSGQFIELFSFNKRADVEVHDLKNAELLVISEFTGGNAEYHYISDYRYKKIDFLSTKAVISISESFAIYSEEGQFFQFNLESESVTKVDFKDEVLFCKYHTEAQKFCSGDYVARSVKSISNEDTMISIVKADSQFTIQTRISNRKSKRGNPYFYLSDWESSSDGSYKLKSNGGTYFKFATYVNIHIAD